MTDLHQTKEFALFLKSQGWIVENSGRDHYFIRKLPLTPFSVIKVQRPSKINFQKINWLAKRHRALAIYVEPGKHPGGGRMLSPGVKPKKTRGGTNQNTPGACRRILPVWRNLLQTHGFRLSGSPFLPTKTIHLDLNQSQKNLLARMKKDVRYSIRKAEKSCKVLKLQGSRGKNTPGACEGESGSPKAFSRLGKENIESLNLKVFHQAWKRSVPFSRYVPSLKALKKLQSAFGNKAIFLIAINTSDGGRVLQGNTSDSFEVDQNNILAGTVILLTDTTAYYYYAFTSKQGRKKLAQYLLVWEAIKIGKRKGCKVFDFEGIYDHRFPIKNWQGFSHFKKSFGGREVDYPGCFVKKRLPFQ